MSGEWEDCIRSEYDAKIIRLTKANAALLEAAKKAFAFVESKSTTASADWIDTWKSLVDAISQAEARP